MGNIHIILYQRKKRKDGRGRTRGRRGKEVAPVPPASPPAMHAALCFIYSLSKRMYDYDYY